MKLEPKVRILNGKGEKSRPEFVRRYEYGKEERRVQDQGLKVVFTFT